MREIKSVSAESRLTGFFCRSDDHSTFYYFDSFSSSLATVGEVYFVFCWRVPYYYHGIIIKSIADIFLRRFARDR